CSLSDIFFFFIAPATTTISTLSLHDALPISRRPGAAAAERARCRRHLRRRQRRVDRLGDPTQRQHDPEWRPVAARKEAIPGGTRSEEHTSELQSLAYLVCRLLLEKKKKQQNT